MTQEVHLGPVIEKLRKGVCRRVTAGRPAVVVDVEETERFMASVADILSVVVGISSTPVLSPALRTTLQQRHDLLREDARTDAANNYRYTTLKEHDASVAEADEIGRLLSARSSAPEAREGEAVGHRPECWGSTSYSGEMAHCYCSQSTAAPSADKLRIAVEALDYIDERKSIAPVWVQQRVRSALAALKAEGC